MKYVCLLSVLLGFMLKAQAQRFVEPDKMKTFNITVNFTDYTVKTQMLKEQKKMTASPDITYSWYTSQKIMETKGGFAGKVLHGYYKSFYLNDQLKESGEYNYGVKSGVWKGWYTDGKLKEITKWKKGRKNGNFSLYNDFGLLMATGNFKNDLLNGKFKTYDSQGNVSLVQKYKNGKEVLKKQKVKKEKTKKEDTLPEGEKQPEKEKKGLFRKSDKAPATTDGIKESGKPVKKEKTKKESTSLQKQDNSTESKPKEKKSFGEKLKSLFKKNPDKEKNKASNSSSSTT